MHVIKRFDLVTNDNSVFSIATAFSITFCNADDDSLAGMRDALFKIMDICAPVLSLPTGSTTSGS